MESVKRRAAIGWVAGFVVLVGIYVWATTTRPTIPGASAGAIARVGLIAAVTVIPVLLTARTMSKFTRDNEVAAVILPMFLAAFIAALVVIFGFTPEDARLCTAFERYEEIAPDPACFTSTVTRLRELAEGIVVWLLFGVSLRMAFRRRERKAQRPRQSVS